MKETLYNEKRFDNFRQIINHSAETFGSISAFQLRNPNGGYLYISYQELRDRYYSLTDYFVSLGYTGKRIAVVGKNSFEWVLCYLCAATVGVAVPIDKELLERDVVDLVHAAECVAVCGDTKHLDALRPLVEAEPLKLIDFAEANQLSTVARPDAKAHVDNLPIYRDVMQILIFTSGTTGMAKGVCLSQYNICSDIYYTVRMVKFTAEDKTLSILPLHHTYECSLDCMLLLSRGACITYCDEIGRIARNLVEYHPTVIVCVPALLRLMSKRVKKSILKGCPPKYKTLFETKSLGEAMEACPFLVRTAIKTLVRKSLGGKLRVFIVGAAELNPSLVKDFEALGIRTLQGYGLTECAPLLAGNGDFYMNPDSTGKPIPGVKLMIDHPNEEGVGEIIAKGDNIMLGYYRDREATDNVFRNGWFHTGDLGRFGDDGELYITGRAKNVIVTENGKNIYPEELESRIAEFDEIGEVLVVEDRADGTPKTKAKILPNQEYLREKLGHMPSAEEISTAIQGTIAHVNSQIPQYKHIRTIEILTAALEKTPTQKIKRFGSNLK